jgi:hypothetical protein
MGRVVPLTIIAGALLLLQGCNGHDHDRREREVRYGEARILARVPDGARRRTATVEVTIRTPDGKKEVEKLMPWSAADAIRLPVGTKSITVEARDASGSVVHRASQKAEVVENQTTDVSISEWQTEKPEDTSRLAAWATLGALVIALALGAGKRLSLAVLLLDHKWTILPMSLVAGFGLATVAIFFWQGTTFLASTALPSLWMLLIPTFVAYAALLELRFVVVSLVPLDSLVVATLVGVAAGIGCLGYPMILTNGFPWLTWLGTGAVALVTVQVYLHERL